MTTQDTDTPGAAQAMPGYSAGPVARVQRGWSRFWRRVAHVLPRGLYRRSLLIVITPMILLQTVVASVFMERHWQTVTKRLSTATVRDVGALVDMVEARPQGSNYSDIIRLARSRLDLTIDVLPPDPLPAQRGPSTFFSILDNILAEEITTRIGKPYWIDTESNSKLIEIRIAMQDRVLRVFAPRGQAYASNTHIFLVWMLGTSLVLVTIAIPFLRNQIKPISALAEAAESFGKGRPPPDDFRPRGADEVRRAGLAFVQMRERIERQIEQRTAMLTGVSHDLRTILTRFRLQLALIGSQEDREALNKDIDDMQSMLVGYLEFARGEQSEDTGRFNLEDYLERLEDEAELRGRVLQSKLAGDPIANVRPHAFGRLLGNIAGNAMRYARNVSVDIVHDGGILKIVVDDDGPGVPESQREEVFKPFVRLEGGRNLDSSGTGLGLAIARDIARSHGGDIVLDSSPLGGLRAIVTVPA